MTVLRRKECPVHGANYGTPTPSESFYGKEWCQHCTRPASELVQVEYVPAVQLKGAVQALSDIREWAGGLDFTREQRLREIEAIVDRTLREQ